ncbi:MAG: class I SAM-dependent methyltransferase [Clostridiales bacterium]|nr:class I SAM-dependent methyltransferase [Clostridiales bacterium]
MEICDSSAGGTIKLSRRLLALAGMVTPGNRLADIGTDHGYIPIFLCQTGVIPSAIAMDVREGPLSRAEAHIRECGLEDRIRIRLSDGMEQLGDGEADTVLIAGMGGRLMHRILSAKSVPAGVTELILQPQSDVALIRWWIRENGFRIADEDMVEEDGKYYPMMKALRQKPCGDDDPIPADPGESDGLRSFSDIARQEMEDAFGPVLLAVHHPVLKQWLEKELDTTEKILEKLEENNSAKNQCRFRELIEKKHLLLAALNCCQ